MRTEETAKCTAPSRSLMKAQEMSSLSTKGVCVHQHVLSSLPEVPFIWWKTPLKSRFIYSLCFFLLSAGNPRRLEKQLTGSGLLSFTLCFNALVLQTVGTIFQNSLILFSQVNQQSLKQALHYSEHPWRKVGKEEDLVLNIYVSLLNCKCDPSWLKPLQMTEINFIQ